MSKQTILKKTAIALLAMLCIVACDDEPAKENASANKPSASANGLTDPRDKKTYKVAKIGSQTWMAENLNYEAEGSKCPDNEPANCNKYGRFYDWKTAMSVCPKGWHLPSDDEWQKLVDFAGGDKAAGAKLKATSGWNSNGNGTNEFGFSALPGGFGSSKNSEFMFVGDGGVWWSATERGSDNAYYWEMAFYHSKVNRNGGNDMGFLLSVRCVQD